MFVIRECDSLREYDLFVEKFALGDKNDDYLYPRCQGELKNVPMAQLPSKIRSDIENEQAISLSVDWRLDLNEKKEILGSILFNIETEKDFIIRIGDFDDWKEFQKLRA